jgi:hypothetical protein
MVEPSQPQDADQRRSFIGRLLARAADLRLPELFVSRHPRAAYWVADRHGVGVVALRTRDLTHDQLVTLMTYRLAQYLMAQQLDPELIAAAQLEHEPLSEVTPSDVHIIAAAPAEGRILCYMTLKSGADHCGSASFGATDRWLFPVERVFGQALYNRLKILPDLPAARVVEIGRFAKNHQADSLSEEMIRAPVEVVLAMNVMLSGELRDTDAAIGDFEEGVARRNIEFFHVPIVVLHGVIPYAEEGSFGFLNYQTRTRVPFAWLCSDTPRERLTAIDNALGLPVKEGILALLALKDEKGKARSSLEPQEGLPALDEIVVPGQGGPMVERRRSLDLGQWLRGSNVFQGLSVSEAAVLGTFLERYTAEAGTVVVRQNEPGDALYLIQAGNAEVHVVGAMGRRIVVASLGPGDSFGEIALVTGGDRTADVVAVTPMTLLRLGKEAYARYLAHLVDVEQQLNRTAALRTRDTLRAVSSRLESGE